MTLILLVGLFGAWSVMSQISGAVIAAGRIEVDQNRQIIQHPEGGVVAELRVDEGQPVQKDDVLLRLDPSRQKLRLAVAEDQLFEIMARRGRLEAERDDVKVPEFSNALEQAADKNPEIADMMAGQMRLFLASRASSQQQIAQLQSQIEQLHAQVTGIEAQQAALSRQLELIERELIDQKKLLNKGLAQVARVLGLERQKAQLLGQVGQLTSHKARVLVQVSEIDSAILARASRLREDAIRELRDLQLRERELMQEIRELRESLSRMVIRAPVTGVVYGLRVFGSGAVLRPADPVMYLVPQDRPLVIAARVAPINIDELRVGQLVFLRFASLDQRTTPEIIGQVTSISADAFIEEPTGHAYYRAEIELRPGEFEKLPDGTTLLPGMPVEAFFRTEDRSPLAYLVKPLADYFARAFREG